LKRILKFSAQFLAAKALAKADEQAVRNSTRG